MSKHRAAVRPRYGRLAVLGASMSVTAIAVLAAVVGLPAQGGSGGVAGAASADRVGGVAPLPATSPLPAPRADAAEETAAKKPAAQEPTAQDPAEDVSLPAASGAGYRVIFSEGRQRVWLVGEDEKVQRTYLVSGSIYDNLDPGTYAVYSRSEQAWGIDDSGTMRHFVRFARGERAAIGFHDIPIADGAPVQTLDQLGTPLSHGCIRQRPADAAALWEFAPLGTTVVVTA